MQNQAQAVGLCREKPEIKKTMKPKTIDELCKKQDGSFKRFVKEKESFLQSLETERKERIAASRKTARDLSWAA